MVAAPRAIVAIPGRFPRLAIFWLSVGVVVERPQVLQTGSVAELVLILKSNNIAILCKIDYSQCSTISAGVTTDLGLNHSWTLRAQYSYSLENVDDTLVLHSLEDNAERDEDASPSDAGATVHRNWAILAELLFRLMHLTDEVDESIDRLRDALLGPVDELELSHRAARAVASVGHLELAQYVLGHIVLGNRIDNEALVANRTIRRPVEVTLFATHLLQLGQHNDDRRIVLPQHAPEVVGRVAQRS